VHIFCSLHIASITQTTSGFSLTFGVLQEYYSTHGDLLGSASSIGIVGATATGLLYLCSPLTFALLTRWPRMRTWCGPIGLAIMVLAFGLSSLARSIGHLIATQGVLSALGSGLLFAPTTLYLDEWFVKRKGLAYGVMWAGKSIAGVVLPFAADLSLRKFGHRNTLLAWTVLVFILTAPVLAFLKPRVPISRRLPVTAARPLNMEFLRMKTFWMLQIGKRHFLSSAVLFHCFLTVVRCCTNLFPSRKHPPESRLFLAHCISTFVCRTTWLRAYRWYNLARRE